MTQDALTLRVRRGRLAVMLASGTAGSLTLAYVVWVLIGGGSSGPYAVTQTLYLSVGLIAVSLAVAATLSTSGSPRSAWAWGLLAVALASFWAADVVWAVQESLTGAVDSPSWGESGYLLYYPLLLASLVLLSRRSGGGRERLRMGLDLSVVFMGGAVLVWYLALRPALDGIGGGVGAVIAAAYPIGDLLLVSGIAFLAVRRNRLTGRAPLFALLAAVIAGFGTDLAYSYTSLTMGSDIGLFTDAGYLVSWFLFAVAAATELRARDRWAGSPHQAAFRDRKGDRTRVLSHVALVVAVAVIVWALRGDFGSAESGAAIVAVLVTLLAMARQITAVFESSRLREESALRASEQRFQQVLRRTQFSVDNASDLILWLNMEGRILDANKSACHRLGYPCDEVRRMTIFQLDPTLAAGPDEPQEAWSGLLQERSAVWETEYLTATDSAFPVEVTINLLSYEGQDLVCLFARDVTKRRAAEKALQETETQLRQSQKMDALGQLAGGIAHDFNNLLTTILGYCDLVLNSDAQMDEALREDVREIGRTTHRAAELTKQILAFSRRQPLEPKLASLNDVVERMGRLLERTLGERIEFVSRLDPSAPTVAVDVPMFEQVIMNLAVNARDAMPVGGTLTIETGLLEPDESFRRRHPALGADRYVVLSVSDTGIGMDEETLAHAFEPFFTTKAEGEGTGLGLATVYGTVRQSGGEVDAHSRPGAGTTMTVYVPEACATVTVPEGGVGRKPAVGAVERPVGRQETILVVEDEDGLKNLVGRVLRSQGYDVLTSRTADEALGILRVHGRSIDLLLTDVVLPGSMLGGEMARQAVALCPDLPVVFMSGYDLAAMVGSGWLQDDVDYLEKPFPPETLLLRVRQVLDGCLPEADLLGSSAGGR